MKVVDAVKKKEVIKKNESLPNMIVGISPGNRNSKHLIRIHPNMMVGLPLINTNTTTSIKFKTILI